MVQGKKRAFQGPDAYSYDSRHFLLLGTPLPLVAEATASSGRPMLAVYIRLRRDHLAKLMHQMAPADGEEEGTACPLRSIPLTDRIAEALHRLLSLLRDPEEAEIMGPEYFREITYLILRGPGGRALRSSMGIQLPALEHNARDALHARRSREANNDCLFVQHCRNEFVCVPSSVQICNCNNARAVPEGTALTPSSNDDSGGTAGCRRSRKTCRLQSLAQFSRDYKRLFSYPPSHPVSSDRSEPMLS